MNKIAHYINSFLPVTENWIFSQISSPTRYRPVVFAGKRENSHIYPVEHIYCLEDDLDRYSCLLNKAWNKLFGIHPFFLRGIKKDGCKLIHAHFGPAGYDALGLKKKLKIPLVTTFYGADASRLPGLKGWLEKYRVLFEKGDLFLTEGPHMKKSLVKLGCPEEKIIVHHLGVNLENIRFKARIPDDNEIRILTAARFEEKKGIFYALKAFAHARNIFDNIRLILIGDGVLRKDIEREIENLKISENVTLMGFQKYEVFMKELAGSHIFMLPSITARDGDSEGGSPVVLIEAQAAGLPVLSTRHADIPEVVVDGKTGFLVPERNEEALAEKLIYLLNNLDTWDVIGRSGREHVEKEYDLRKQAQRLEGIYDSIIL